MPEPAIDPDLLNSCLAQFQRDGFLVVKDVFDRQRVRELLDSLHREHPEYLGQG